MRAPFVVSVLLLALLTPHAVATDACVGGGSVAADACAGAAVGQGTVCVVAGYSTSTAHQAWRACLPTGVSATQAGLLLP